MIHALNIFSWLVIFAVMFVAGLYLLVELLFPSRDEIEESRPKPQRAPARLYDQERDVA